MNVNDFKGDFVQAVEFLKGDISQLRTGRATTAMLDSRPKKILKGNKGSSSSS
jgi:ribosome recycling factor